MSWEGLLFGEAESRDWGKVGEAISMTRAISVTSMLPFLWLQKPCGQGALSIVDLLRHPI